MDEITVKGQPQVQPQGTSSVQIKDGDKVLAAAVNISAIFFPYLGPIVGSIVGAKSPFIKFHAYRCLIEQILTTLILGFLMACSLSYSIYSLYNTQKDGFDLSKIDWVTILFKAFITWLLLGIWTLLNAFLSIRDAIQALNGRLPVKPKWTERKAMKLSGLDYPSLPSPK